MDCSEVKEILSAYYDNELSSDNGAAIADHLAACDDCARELDVFRNLSAMTERLSHPEPPAHIWQQLEKELGNKQPNISERRTLFDWLGWTKRPATRLGLAMAAAVLIAIGWFGYSTWSEHDPDHQMAAVFGEYLEEFRRDPGAAQNILLANYEGQSVDVGQAVQTVGYRPLVADGMPAGYTVGQTYVMKMPCCTCVQCLCQRSDGTTIAIFEHDDEEPDWFGDRPATEAECNGTRCSLVELDDKIAATWQRGKRHITVIGVEDRAEVERLIAWFDDRKRALPN